MEHEVTITEEEGGWTARCCCGWDTVETHEALALFRWTRHADGAL